MNNTKLNEIAEHWSNYEIQNPDGSWTTVAAVAFQEKKEGYLKGRKDGLTHGKLLGKRSVKDKAEEKSNTVGVTSEALALIQKQEREEVEEIIVAYEKQNEIFRWLLGYEDFPERKAGEGAYWWRKPLREKLNKIRKLSTSSEE